ncbi:hypothetical protein [Streptomyces sp. NRRL F-5727]|uniref:hypothetical protein n=1 Tax=Streptomyces sp. NRRL F-5727 TaxID=1463871 RepID=UPI00069163EB|nr:hypothetical protein [Streptomyces sp. NRRL F-5727]
MALQQEVRRTTVAALREEAGAGPDDPLPLLVGGQIAWIQEAVVEFVGDAVIAEGRRAPSPATPWSSSTRSRNC